MTTIGGDRFLALRHATDPVAYDHPLGVIDFPATEYIRLARWQRDLARLAALRMDGVDAL